MISQEHRFHGLGGLRFLYRNARVVRSPLVSLKYAANPKHQTYRLAVVVSRKVSKLAVVRNRIRRRLYEAVRLQADSLQPGFDLALMVYSPDLANLPARDIKRIVKDLLSKAKVAERDNKSNLSTPTRHGIVGDKGK